MLTMSRVWLGKAVAVLGLTFLAACGPSAELPPAYLDSAPTAASSDYRIGPLDQLQIFVWRNPELSVNLTVRPDGHISMPLVDDMVAAGRTAEELAKEIETVLSETIRNPDVSVMTLSFNGTFDQQVRVIGEAANPRALQYRADMTLIDVMIEVGGLTVNAAGNSARLIRIEDGTPKEYSVKIGDLVNRGDVDANVRMRPGDVVVIPATIF